MNAQALPAIAKLVIDGITVVMTGTAAMEIAKHLGKTWDGVEENGDGFVKGVSTHYLT